MIRSVLRGYRDAFSGLPRQVWVLATCLFVNRMGMMVLPYLTLYLTERRGLGEETAGRIVASYGVGAMLGVTLGGRLTDRFGSKAVQIASLVMNALGLLFLWRMRATLAIGASALAVGCASDAFRPANAAAISVATEPEARARSYSLMSLAVNVGLSLGLPIGGLLARLDFDFLFWIDAGTALLAAALLWRMSASAPPARPADGPRPATRSPWSDGTFLGVVALQCVVATVLFQFFGALPLFLKQDLGFDKAAIGRLLALNTLMTAAFGMLVVRWAERRAELAWIGVGSFLICTGYGLNLFTGLLPMAYVSVVVWSVGEMLYFPLGASFASRRASPQDLGRYLGLYHLGISSALVLSPLIGTKVYADLGPRALWAGCAVTGFVVLALYTGLQRRGGRR